MPASRASSPIPTPSARMAPGPGRSSAQSPQAAAGARISRPSNQPSRRNDMPAMARSMTVAVPAFLSEAQVARQSSSGL